MFRPSSLVDKVLFPCPEPSYTIDSFPGELIWISKKVPGSSSRAPSVAGDGLDSVPCLLNLYESAHYLLIFFHSNAEDLGRCRWFCRFLRDQFQVHVLAVEYPGYGVCPGPVSKQEVLAHAHAALHFATKVLNLRLDQIKVFGRSIGTAPALALASHFDLAGLVLVTPFKSVRSLFQDRIGPLAYFIEEWFANDLDISEVTCPTLFIHGRSDAMIPFHHCEALYKLCKARKLLISPEGMDHNSNLCSDMSYLIIPMFKFFALPELCNTELEVPAWAFDKRRSPLYVRPSIEVCFSKRPSGDSRGSAGSSLKAPPAGDDEMEPVEAFEDLSPSSNKGLSKAADVIDPRAFTTQLVLQSFTPIVQRRDLRGASGANVMGGFHTSKEFREVLDEDEEDMSPKQGPGSASSCSAPVCAPIYL
ncbi:unnamed protein product [Polarella glacialis]|uniref:Serine aminopeptidase S33 domain-containing protein n=1 Tax=Polarella glacialis TaxID=89957 RepID=A0A813KWU2_POLGL|nr:unnamed protein product [Polarella glacialis]CAE8716847.1 unnamed protein product [Polarella glacialis]|mmetsp:Transcript_45636/g.74106  ORF Transcript_45636/g.74106 Transcript_45636/m.74106 type:complete len:418 (+) Transcript_45636:141-1394(+)